MPAPHTLVVQLHSRVCRSLGLAGIWQASTVLSLETGNGVVAPACSRAMSCPEVRLPFTASIRPAMPETMGAEKLVPTLKFVSSV